MVVRSPFQENDPADAHTSVHKSVLEAANPAWMRSVHLDAPCQWHAQQPVSGTANPGVKQDTSSRGFVDITKTRADPQRVGMCSSERPIGATKGKQTKTMASCQHPPPPAWWTPWWTQRKAPLPRHRGLEHLPPLPSPSDAGTTSQGKGRVSREVRIGHVGRGRAQGVRG